jgi:ATP-dependent DNA helicase RecG
MLDEAVMFIARNMRVKTIINGEGKRADKEEYPMRAVREAILNALMHRDYSVNTEGMPVQIRMFYDRLEIISPGGLFGHVTLNSLGKVQPDTRNRTLATALEVLGMAENRYSGIPTIRRECEGSKLPEPTFRVVRGQFTVTIYNDQANRVNDDRPMEERLLEFCKTPRTRAEIVALIGMTRDYALRTYVDPLVSDGRLRLTIPEIPSSKKQQYVSGV